MSFAVVIPSRNGQNLGACTAAVREHEPDAQIVVVDDFDGPKHFLHPSREPVDWIEGVRPFIFARNVNLGIRRAWEMEKTGVVLLNDDALLKSPGGFSLLARTCEEHPEIGVIGASTNLGHRCQHPQNKGLRIVEHVAYVAVYIPRRTFEAVGFLDERFGGVDGLGRRIYGYEDEDYDHRVKLAGLKVAVHDGCYVDHGSLRSTFRGDPKTPASLEPGRAVFKQKWPGVHGY